MCYPAVFEIDFAGDGNNLLSGFFAFEVLHVLGFLKPVECI
jgi:hypothetical protein